MLDYTELKTATGLYRVGLRAVFAGTLSGRQIHRSTEDSTTGDKHSTLHAYKHTYITDTHTHSTYTHTHTHTHTARNTHTYTQYVHTYTHRQPNLCWLRG